MTSPKTEIRDGMRVEWNVPIPMDDGIVLRCDIFRPVGEDKVPAILTYGPYAKGLAFQEGYKSQWDRMVASHPEVARGTTSRYQNWEVVDPEKWVPDGYACVRIDSRGAGRSPGYLDVWSERETRDFRDCIEWAAAQPWCSGKIGLNGISYYAMNQWTVACLQPPHLSALCVWEGAADYYRDTTHHGGIVNMMPINWFPRQVKSVQYGLGTRGPKSRVTGEPVAGPETLPEAELARNRCDFEQDILSRPLDGDWYRKRSPDWDQVKAPLLSSANWGGMGLHPRGNFEGFTQSASQQKWLEVHGLAHWTHFYTDYGLALQKRFFGYFLKGEKNGWDRQPRVRLQVRHPGNRFVQRDENEWPLARTRWTRYHLQPADRSLGLAPPAGPAQIAFEALGDGLTFFTPPLQEELEITGPVAAKLWVSSSTRDADLFLALRVFAPDGKEVVFEGSNDPRVPVGLGWLRASHRKLDLLRTRPYRPYHSHDELQPLTPRVPVELDVEIWPTCIVVPPGHRIGLTVRGKDYHGDGPPLVLPGGPYPMTGVGPFLHNHPQDRPAAVFGGTTTLHTGPDRPGYVLLPVIPARR